MPPALLLSYLVIDSAKPNRPGNTTLAGQSFGKVLNTMAFSSMMSFLLGAFFCILPTSASFVPFPYMGADIVDIDNSFGNTTAISATCAAALNTTINCEERLQYMTGSFAPWRSQAASTLFCAQACRSSLQTYSTNVRTACGTADAFNGLVASWRGDQVRDYLNVMCLTETSTGKYCVGTWTQSTPRSLQVCGFW